MSTTGMSLWYEESPRGEDAPLTTPTRISTIRHDYPLVSGRLGAEPQMKSRDDEARGNLSPTPGIVERYEPAGAINVGAYPNKIVPLYGLAGLLMTPTQGDGANEVQAATASGTVSGGTYDLTIAPSAGYSIVLTGIPWNYTAAQVQTLIDDAIRRGGTGFWLGDVVIGGGPLPATPMTITYQGQLAATNVAPAVLEDASLTGSTPAYTISTTTPGSVGTVLLPDGRGIPPSVYRWVSTKQTGNKPQTARLLSEYAEHSTWEYGSGFAASQIQMGADGMVQATLLGLVSQPAADPSITRSFDALTAYPFLDRDLLVTWRTGSGRVSSLPWQIANPIVAEPNRATRSKYPGLMFFGDGYVVLSGTVELTDVDPDDRTAHYEGDLFAARAHYRSRSKIGSTGALYEQFVDIPAAQITGGPGPEEISAKRRFTSSYAWEAKTDEATGKDFTITVTSGLSAIAQYT